MKIFCILLIYSYLCRRNMCEPGLDMALAVYNILSLFNVDYLAEPDNLPTHTHTHTHTLYNIIL